MSHQYSAIPSSSSTALKFLILVRLITQ